MALRGGVLVTCIVGLCLLPSASAFAEGSVNVNRSDAGFWVLDDSVGA